LREESEANDLAAAGDRSANREKADRADALALSSDILLGAAVTAVVVGAVLHLLGSKRSAGLSLTPRGASVAFSY
jgi:hypothetical protein